MALLTVRNLTKRFGGLMALNETARAEGAARGVVSGIEGSVVTGRIDLSEDRGVNNLGSDRSIP